MSDYDKNGCRNCGTRRRREGRGGYCNKCAGLMRKLRALQRKTYRYAPIFAPQAWYDRNIQTVEEALKNLKNLEQPLIDWVAEPEEIEELLFSIINAAHLYIPHLCNIRSYLHAVFPPKGNERAYAALYYILLSIVDALPCEKYRTRSQRLWWWR